MLIDPYQFQPARIEQLVREAKAAVSVRVSLPGGYTFKAGQHAVVRVTMPDGSKLVRQYSFSAPPSSNELWFTIVQEPQGQVSGWFVTTAKVGDELEISHPFAGPLMQKIPRGEICMIAGGSGIAPLMALTRELRTLDRSFTLLYSTRTGERCFARELTPLPHESISVRLTDTEPRFSGSEIQAKLSPDSTVFICGSRPLVLAIREICEKVLPAEQIYSEAFSL